MLDAVAKILERRRSQGWLVGGSVRDRLLERYSPDLDVVVADDAAAVAEQLAQALRAPWFALSERHLAYRILGTEGQLDVAAVRGDSIWDDLGQRDFTVNAMAAPVGPETMGSSLKAESLLDPFGGAAHLREKRLVAVSDRIFADDPLRLMRAPRFCHTLGLALDDDLARSIRRQAQDLAGAAEERVVSEMRLTLAAGRAADAAARWHELGLLGVFLPEWTTVWGDGGGGKAGGVVLNADDEGLSATLAFLQRLDDLLDGPGAWFPEVDPLLAKRWAQPVDGMLERPVALRMAGLMYGLSVSQSRAVARRLKLSTSALSLLETLAHGLAGQVPVDTAPTREAVLFLWESAPWEPEVIALTAVAIARNEEDNKRGGSVDSRRLAAMRRLMSLWAERALRGIPRLPVDGETLMRDFGLESGPTLGKALREVRLAWESGEIDTASQALAVARCAVGGGCPRLPRG